MALSGLASLGFKKAKATLSGWLSGSRKRESGLLLGGGLSLLALVVALTPASLLYLIALFAHKSLYFANSVRLVSGRNMKIMRRRFNTYLFCLCFALGIAQGAEPAPDTGSTNAPPKTADEKKKEEKKKKKKKEKSTIRVHVEMARDGSERTRQIPVLRDKSMMISIDAESFLDESHLVESKVISTPGGPEIELQFNSIGRTLLENTTAANRGRRLAIYTDFDKEHRWIAAPVITKLLSNGILRFTPDATQEEAERIVRGLNTVAEVKEKKKKKDDL